MSRILLNPRPIPLFMHRYGFLIRYAEKRHEEHLALTAAFCKLRHFILTRHPEYHDELAALLPRFWRTGLGRVDAPVKP